MEHLSTDNVPFLDFSVPFIGKNRALPRLFYFKIIEFILFFIIEVFNSLLNVLISLLKNKRGENEKRKM